MSLLNFWLLCGFIVVLCFCWDSVCVICVNSVAVCSFNMM